MSGSTLFSIGEALIDMIPSKVGCSFDEVPSFSPRTGGAPANVCAAFARLACIHAFTAPRKIPWRCPRCAWHPWRTSPRRSSRHIPA